MYFRISRVKHLCLFSKLAARMGAYFHGVLINTCGSMQLCGNGLAVYILGLEDLISVQCS